MTLDDEFATPDGRRRLLAEQRETVRRMSADYQAGIVCGMSPEAMEIAGTLIADVQDALNDAEEAGRLLDAAAERTQATADTYRGLLEHRLYPLQQYLKAQLLARRFQDGSDAFERAQRALREVEATIKLTEGLLPAGENDR